MPTVLSATALAELTAHLRRERIRADSTPKTKKAEKLTAARQVRAAKTTVEGMETYPAAGEGVNTFRIELGSLSFTKTPGAQTPTFTAYTGDDRYRVVWNPRGYVPEGTIVLVNMVHGQYYVVEEFMTTNILCKAAEAEDTCASFDVDEIFGIDGANDQIAGETFGTKPATLSVYNRHKFDVEDNAWCRAHYVREKGQWELYQANCPGTEVCT